MGAGVVEVLSLEIDLRAAAMLAQPLGVVKRRRPADVVAQQVAQFGLKGFVLLGLFVFRRQLIERPGQSFRHIPPPELPKPAVGVGNMADRSHRQGAFCLFKSIFRADTACCSQINVKFSDGMLTLA